MTMKLKSTSSNRGGDNENALNTFSNHSTTTTTSSSSLTSNAISTSKQTTSITANKAVTLITVPQQIPSVVNQSTTACTGGTTGQKPLRRTNKVCRAFIQGYCGRKQCRVSSASCN